MLLKVIQTTKDRLRLMRPSPARRKLWWRPTPNCYGGEGGVGDTGVASGASLIPVSPGATGPQLMDRGRYRQPTSAWSADSRMGVMHGGGQPPNGGGGDAVGAGI